MRGILPGCLPPDGFGWRLWLVLAVHATGLYFIITGFEQQPIVISGGGGGGAGPLAASEIPEVNWIDASVATESELAVPTLAQVLPTPVVDPANDPPSDIPLPQTQKMPEPTPEPAKEVKSDPAPVPLPEKAPVLELRPVPKPVPEPPKEVVLKPVPKPQPQPKVEPQLTPVPKPVIKPTPKPLPPKAVTPKPVPNPAPPKEIAQKLPPKLTPAPSPVPAPLPGPPSAVRAAPVVKRLESASTQSGPGGMGSGMGAGTGTGSGFGTGPGSGGPGGLDAISGFHQSVKDSYFSQWQQPHGLTASGSKYRVRTEIVIERSGSIASARIVTTSGNAEMDQSVREAVGRVSKVAPVPKGIEGSRYALILNFDI